MLTGFSWIFWNFGTVTEAYKSYAFNFPDLPQKYIPSDIIRFHTTPEFGTSSLDGILL
jgi:hypothetical protein